MLRQRQAPSPGAAKASHSQSASPVAPSGSVPVSDSVSGPSSPPTAVSSSSAPHHLPSHIKKRLHRSGAQTQKMADPPQDDTTRRSLLQDDGPRDGDEDGRTMTWSRRNQWVLLALASGACAAFNGVFAKLTTTELTTTFAQGIANFFGLSAIEGTIEFIVRCMFFGLNLVFNGVMWTLFTAALARGNSTTQVSIMNTSSNFFITAILGLAIFSESLPPLWWLGAALLVAGNVIIGRKDESSNGDNEEDAAPTAASLAEDGLGEYYDIPPVAAPSVAPVQALLVLEGKDDEEDEDVADLGELAEVEEDTQ